MDKFYFDDIADEKLVGTILMLAYEQGIIAPVADGDTHDCVYCNGTGILVNVVCPFCGCDTDGC